MITLEEKFNQLETLYSNIMDTRNKTDEIYDLLMDNEKLENAEDSYLSDLGVNVKNSYQFTEGIITSVVVGVVFFIIGLIVGHFYEWKFSVKLGLGILAAIVCLIKGGPWKNFDYIKNSLTDIKNANLRKIHSLKNEPVYLEVKNAYIQVHSKYFECTDSFFEQYLCYSLIELWKRIAHLNQSLSLEEVMEKLINNSDKYINYIMLSEASKEEKQNINTEKSDIKNLINAVTACNNEYKTYKDYILYLDELLKIDETGDLYASQNNNESNFLKEMNISNESAESPAETNDNSLYDKSTNSAMERFRNQKK